MLWCVEHYYAGPFLIIFSTMVTVVLMGPYNLFAIGTGYAFQRIYKNLAITLTLGPLIVFLGAWVGAIIAFFISRKVCRKKVQLLTSKYKMLNAFDEAVQTEGIKLIFLMRLSLIVPFNVSNYAFGGSSVVTRHFIIGTLGLIPMCVYFVYLGTTISSIQDLLNNDTPVNPVTIAMYVVGALLGLTVLVSVSLVVRKIL